MTTPACFPYRSDAARQLCFAYLDSLASRQWPIASDERLVPTSYGETFVRISGPREAPPLLLFHGATATSLMWAPNIKALSAEYRTFAVDQIGEFGRSICTKPIEALNDLVRWMDELFEGLELRAGVNLVGISYGGASIAQYALHFPARLNKIVLLAPGMTVLRVTTEFIIRTAWAMVARRWGLPSFLRWIFATMAQKDPRWIDEIIEQTSLNFQSLQRRKVVIPPVLTDAEWCSLTVPAMFLVGEREVIYSAEKAVRRLRRVAPQVRAEIVPGAGHDFSVAEADAVNRKILDFLRPTVVRLAAAS